VRVATFNINNINKRLDNLLAWLSKAQPDVVSLQEAGGLGFDFRWYQPHSGCPSAWMVQTEIKSRGRATSLSDACALTRSR